MLFAFEHCLLLEPVGTQSCRGLGISFFVMLLGTKLPTPGRPPQRAMLSDNQEQVFVRSPFHTLLSIRDRHLSVFI